MATKLRLYNEALTAIKRRTLASLTEDREPRRVLDTAYAGFIDFVLEQGNWKFALRSSLMTYDSNITPTFGHNRAYAKPTDFIRLNLFSTDEFFRTPLLDYQDEGGYWYASHDDIYVSYVSNDSAFGGDLSLWPESFTKYAVAELAARVVERLNPEMDATRVEANAARILEKALAKDAIAAPTSFMRPGTWTTARGGQGRGDRGNRGSLIG